MAFGTHKYTREPFSSLCRTVIPTPGTIPRLDTGVMASQRNSSGGNSACPLRRTKLFSRGYQNTINLLRSTPRYRTVDHFSSHAGDGAAAAPLTPFTIPPRLIFRRAVTRQSTTESALCLINIATPFSLFSMRRLKGDDLLPGAGRPNSCVALNYLTRYRLQFERVLLEYMKSRGLSNPRQAKYVRKFPSGSARLGRPSSVFGLIPALDDTRGP